MVLLLQNGLVLHWDIHSLGGASNLGQSAHVFMDASAQCILTLPHLRCMFCGVKIFLSIYLNTALGKWVSGIK